MNWKLITAAVLIGLALVCYSQYQRIERLKSFKDVLVRDIAELREENNELSAQYKIINEALSHVANQKENAEQQSITLRSQLKNAQTNNQCVAVLVPADVIRMQRDSITKTNQRFNVAKSTTSTLSAP